MRQVIQSIWWWVRLIIVIVLALYAGALLLRNADQEATIWYWFGQPREQMSIVALALVSFLAGGLIMTIGWALFTAQVQYRRTLAARRRRVHEETRAEIERKAAMLRTKPTPQPIVRTPKPAEPLPRPAPATTTPSAPPSAPLPMPAPTPTSTPTPALALAPAAASTAPTATASAAKSKPEPLPIVEPSPEPTSAPSPAIVTPPPKPAATASTVGRAPIVTTAVPATAMTAPPSSVQQAEPSVRPAEVSRVTRVEATRKDDPAFGSAAIVEPIPVKAQPIRRDDVLPAPMPEDEEKPAPVEPQTPPMPPPAGG